VTRLSPNIASGQEAGYKDLLMIVRGEPARMRRFVITSLLCSILASGSSASAQPAFHNKNATAQIPAAAQALINRYNMQPVPVEGGWFSQLQRTTETIAGSALPARYAGVTHPLSTAILFVETRRDFSALHTLKTAEIWHFYAGDPVHLLLLHPDGRGQSITLDRDHPAYVVPEGVWQGSAPIGPAGWSFVGTTMAPGFIPEDFQLGERKALSERYPAFRKQITALTRVKDQTQ